MDYYPGKISMVTNFPSDAMNISNMPHYTAQGGNMTLSNMTVPQGFQGDAVAAKCLVYDFVIEAVLMGVLCLFGFAGNTLSMICLWRDKSKTATPFLLISLEIADTLFLVTVLILQPGLKSLSLRKNSKLYKYYFGSSNNIEDARKYLIRDKKSPKNFLEEITFHWKP